MAETTPLLRVRILTGYRGFKSLTVRHHNENASKHRNIGTSQDKKSLSSHFYDTSVKNYDTALRLYRVNQTYYYRRKYQQKLYRISLRTKDFRIALYRKRLFDLLEGDELFKLTGPDYELIFEYDTPEELEAYLKLTQADREGILKAKANYENVQNKLVKQANKDVGDSIIFRELSFKFVDAKKKAGNVSKSSYKAYESTFNKLMDYFKNRSIKSLELEDYEDFRLYLQDKLKLKNSTINNHMNYLNTFLDFALHRKLIPENNAKGLESLEVEASDKENFTEEEMLNILAYDKEKNFEDFYLIAAYTGMRQNEIWKLRREDIKIDKKSGVVYFDIDKSKSEAGVRKVPIHPKILEKLDDMKFPIFGDDTLNAVQKKLNRRLDKIVPNRQEGSKSFHTIRANFIEKCLEIEPEKIPLIQDVVGHSKDDKIKLTVDRYAKGFSFELKQQLVNQVSY